MILSTLAMILPLCAEAPAPIALQEPKPPEKPTREGLKDRFAALDLYPPQRTKTRLLFFSLDGDIRADPIRKALSELATKDAECRIAYGPVTSAARPNKNFVAVEAPVEKTAHDVQRALKHGVPGVEELAFTCFQGNPKQMGGGKGAMPGMSPRDWILGMTNDLRWVESFLGFSEFFFAPGKVTADLLTDRFRKLGEPFGQGDIGKLVKDEFTWTLTVPQDGALDPAAAKRAEKTIAKIDGVREAKIDVTAKTLHIVVELDGLRVGGPPLSLALPKLGGAGTVESKVSGDTSIDVPRIRFDTTPIFDALDKEKLVVAAPVAAGAKPADEPKNPGGGK